MSLEQWALPQLSKLLPLDEASLKQVIVYVESLPDDKATEHLKGLLGDSEEASEFITFFEAYRSIPDAPNSEQAGDVKGLQQPNNDKEKELPPPYVPPPNGPPMRSANFAHHRPHTNQVIQAGDVRAVDEVCYTPIFCKISRFSAKATDP